MVSMVLSHLVAKKQPDLVHRFLDMHLSLDLSAIDTTSIRLDNIPSHANELLKNVHLTQRLIQFLCQCGDTDKAVALFEYMACSRVTISQAPAQDKNFGPNLTCILNSVLESVVIGSYELLILSKLLSDRSSHHHHRHHPSRSEEQAAHYSKLLHIASRTGIRYNTQTYNLLLLATSHQPFSVDAQSRHDDHLQISTNTDQPITALVCMLYLCMVGEGLQPNLVTALVAIPSLARLDLFNQVRTLWQEAKTLGGLPFSLESVRQVILRQAKLLGVSDAQHQQLSLLLRN